MKKILASLLLLLSSTAFADGHFGGHGGYHGGGGYYHSHGTNWVAPALIGGIIGYELAQPRVIYTQPPVVYQYPVQPQAIPESTPYGYHYETILDASCNCYRNVLVRNYYYR